MDLDNETMPLRGRIVDKRVDATIVTAERSMTLAEENAKRNEHADMISTRVPRYSHERYANIIEAVFDDCRALGVNKGGEYAGDDDRLDNFRRNGDRLGLPMETVWAVYAGKHWDAIQQFIKDRQLGKERLRTEPMAGRAKDLIVYLLLFIAMLDERGFPIDKS